MSSNCPHCYTRVLPMADGRCPSCRKDMRDLSGVDSTREAYTFSIGEALPSVCIHCGSGTSESVRVGSSKGVQKNDAARGVLMTLAAGVLGLLVWGGTSSTRAGEEYKRVTLKIPLCPGCQSTVEAKPKYVDHERGLVTYVAHTQFVRKAKAVRRAR